MVTGWPRILMYHSISPVVNSFDNDTTSPEQLESHLRYLALRKLRGVSIKELRRAVRSGNAKGLVGLTFDDGYEDFLTTALPRLERFGFSATVFVLGSMPIKNSWAPHQHGMKDLRTRKLLQVESVREVAARGMEVGSHGLKHIGLSGLSSELLEKEVNSSHRVLSEILGEAVEGFCYPYGSVDDKVVQTLRRSPYTYACATVNFVERDIYNLPRIPVAERDALLRFAAKLKVFSQYHAVKKVLRRKSGLGSQASL